MMEEGAVTKKKENKAVRGIVHTTGIPSRVSVW
jgi:hypothetical protein